MSPAEAIEKYIAKEGRMQVLRLLTPTLIVLIGFFARDYLARIDANTNKLYQGISDVKTQVTDYELKSENRFSVLETRVSDIQFKINNK